MRIKKSTTFIFILSFVIFMPTMLLAGTNSSNIVPLIPIPGLDYNAFNSEEYLQIFYIFAIAAAGLLAVGKLILAGFVYLTSEIITVKGGAKKDIQSALIGLLIVLTAVVILRTINPKLANLPTLENIYIEAVQPSARSVPDFYKGTTLSNRDAYIKDCSEVGGKFPKGNLYAITPDKNQTVPVSNNNLCCSTDTTCNNTNYNSDLNNTNKLDTTKIYTIYEPALPSDILGLGLEAGIHNGEKATILHIQTLGNVGLRSGEETVINNPKPAINFVVKFENGEIENFPCNSLKPTPPGC